jgi:hypothetical protein
MAEVPEKFDTRIRAYLLLKRHGQTLCQRTEAEMLGVPRQHLLSVFHWQPSWAMSQGSLLLAAITRGPGYATTQVDREVATSHNEPSDSE